MCGQAQDLPLQGFFGIELAKYLAKLHQDLRKFGVYADLERVFQRKRNELRYYKRETVRKRINCVSPIHKTVPTGSRTGKPSFFLN